MITDFIKKLFTHKNNTLSFREGMNLTDLPVVTLTQGDKKLTFLLDTGSNNCIIDARMLESIQYTKKEEKSSLFGLDGIHHITDICSITLECQDNTYTYEYIVKDMSEVFDSIKAETGVMIHGILGSKFFNAYKYILDFDKLIAYSKA